MKALVLGLLLLACPPWTPPIDDPYCRLVYDTVRGTYIVQCTFPEGNRVPGYVIPCFSSDPRLCEERPNAATD